MKIPKVLSESVIRRRTDNTIAKRKSTKWQTTIYKTLHRKLKIKQREPHLRQRVNTGALEGKELPAPLVVIL
jgi:hypothetical protein